MHVHHSESGWNCTAHVAAHHRKAMARAIHKSECSVHYCNSAEPTVTTDANKIAMPADFALNPYQSPHHVTDVRFRPCS